MARKKKRSRSKKSTQAVEQSPFWAMAGGIIMILLAIFMMLGGFKAGGPLPEGLFAAGNWAFGWGAYMVPIALVFFGVLKFTSEDHRVPLSKLISMSAFLVTFSAWLHVAFVSGDLASGFVGGYGGRVGELIGGITLSALTKTPASIMFFIFSMLAFFFAFNISPEIFFKVGDLFSRPEKEEDTDLSKLKSEHSFTLKEGVPVVHSATNDDEPPKRRMGGIKNSMQKLTKEENHEALTAKSDPNWKFPDISLLNQKQDRANPGNVKENAEKIRQSLANFNIGVEMEGANVGPRVTQYMLKPDNGVKLSKLASYSDNLAFDLAATAIRIEAPIPGKSAVGIEVPNIKASTVRLSAILQSPEWRGNQSPLGFAVGKDIIGTPVTESLDKMPHLLVAGQTGAGKSVMINSILTSLLYKNSPSDLKLILVDPKQVELKPYDDIPHLLTPVIIEPEKCISALKWTVAEMERRLKTMSEARVRSISEFNLKQEKGMPNMPYIVVVIDELSDLMMMAAKDVESLIVRIAQKARAAGIHLILATQRPSVNVVTGIIKANVPGRIAFTTQSQVDSRTIIDKQGAEKLLGKGDLLLSVAGMHKPKRIQAALITDDEVNKVTDFIRSQSAPQYDDEVVSQPVQLNGRGGVVVESTDMDDPTYKEAVRVVIEGRKASTSTLQRRLRIGYQRAARYMETMEEQGIIGPPDGSRPRDVLVSSVDEAFGVALDEPMPDDEEPQEDLA